MRRLAVFLLDVGLGLAMVCASTALGAQVKSAPGPVADSVLEAQTRTLSAQLRCPVCQGLSLQDSPSELSQQMRDVVRSQLASGKTPDEVKAYFVGRYGEWILMEPAPRGFNWLVYVLPLVALAAGGWLLVAALRRWTAAPTNTSVTM
jgi:cytochrome c-type biogenesis protein CcmH